MPNVFISLSKQIDWTSQNILDFILFEYCLELSAVSICLDIHCIEGSGSCFTLGFLGKDFRIQLFTLHEIELPALKFH